MSYQLVPAILNELSKDVGALTLEAYAPLNSKSHHLSQCFSSSKEFVKRPIDKATHVFGSVLLHTSLKSSATSSKLTKLTLLFPAPSSYLGGKELLGGAMFQGN
jgi:hypothetical protein